MKKNRLLLFSVFFFVAVLFGLPGYSSQWRSYLVKKNDVLLKVLKSQGLRPLFGKSGSLGQTIDLNPSLARHQGNLIYPNQKILLPVLDDEKAAEPVRKIASEQAKAGEDLARLSLSFGTGFMSVAGTDTSNFTGTTDTQSYTLTQLSYRQYWNEAKLATEFTIGLHSVKLAPPLSLSHSQSDFSLVSFGIGFDKQLEDGIGLLIGFRSDPIYFVDSRTGSTLETTSAHIGTLSLGVRKTVMKYKALSSEISLNALVTIPQKTTIQFYSGWGGQLEWRNEYRSGHWGVAGGAQYLMRKIHTDVQKMDQTSVSVSLGVGYYFTDE